jgi:uncharacterized protein involved in propanediol utilization
MNKLNFEIKCKNCGNKAEIVGKTGEIGSEATAKIQGDFEITSPTTVNEVSLICKKCKAFTVIVNHN